MTELKTRFATDTDSEAIAALVNAAFKVERFFIDRDRIDPGKVREMLRTGKYLLAEKNGALIACVYEEAEDYARSSGCEFMDLRIVNLRAELPPFYQRLGYVETGTEPFAADAEPSQPCHFIKMSKPLGTARAAENT